MHRRLVTALLPCLTLLAACDGPPPTPVIGQDLTGAWIVQSVEGVQVIDAVIRVEFRKGGQILGKGPCHTGEVRWWIIEGNIHLEHISYEPDPTCPAPLRDLTEKYIAAARRMTRASMDQGRLVVYDSTGREQLTFRRADSG